MCTVIKQAAEKALRRLNIKKFDIVCIYLGGSCLIQCPTAHDKDYIVVIQDLDEYKHLCLHTSLPEQNIDIFIVNKTKFKTTAYFFTDAIWLSKHNNFLLAGSFPCTMYFDNKFYYDMLKATQDLICWEDCKQITKSAYHYLMAYYLYLNQGEDLSKEQLNNLYRFHDKKYTAEEKKELQNNINTALRSLLNKKI